MSEVALTADNLVIIGQGHVLETTTVSAFVAEHSTKSIRVVTPDPARLHAIFANASEVTVTPDARKPANPRRGMFYATKSIAAALFALAVGMLALFTHGRDVTALTGGQWRIIPVTLIGFPHSHRSYRCSPSDSAA